QSEILGPFLWGKRAESKLITSQLSTSADFVSARHNGYSPVTHTRSVTYTKPNLWVIRDEIAGEYETGELTFRIAKDIPINQKNTDQIELIIGSHKLLISFSASSPFTVTISSCWVSD